MPRPPSPAPARADRVIITSRDTAAGTIGNSRSQLALLPHCQVEIASLSARLEEAVGLGDRDEAAALAATIEGLHDTVSSRYMSLSEATGPRFAALVADPRISSRIPECILVWDPSIAIEDIQSVLARTCEVQLRYNGPDRCPVGRLGSREAMLSNLDRVLCQILEPIWWVLWLVWAVLG